MLFLNAFTAQQHNLNWLAQANVITSILQDSKLGRISNLNENNSEFDPKCWSRICGLNSNSTKFDGRIWPKKSVQGRFWLNLVLKCPKIKVFDQINNITRQKIWPILIKNGLKKVKFCQIQPQKNSIFYFRWSNLHLEVEFDSIRKSNLMFEIRNSNEFE